MAVGFKVGNIIDEVGTPDFLHAFFSTISYHLEPNGWGTKYPELLLQFYQEGKLDSARSEKAHAEALEIRDQLKSLSPDQVIWDIENLQAKPPWGNNISPDITDLSNYFVTSTGRDLFEVLLECLEASKMERTAMTIEQI